VDELRVFGLRCLACQGERGIEAFGQVTRCGGLHGQAKRELGRCGGLLGIEHREAGRGRGDAGFRRRSRGERWLPNRCCWRNPATLAQKVFEDPP
jgi:hypothetical protein